ncbi:MAG: hypothetical protein JST26_13320 [Bacteroidetes bacterium]|nr:hypothetical protein [Bacteroidota bacterium]
MVLSLNQSCRIKINALCIKGSCELTNGVLFEQLIILTKDSAGLPSEYTVTARFACYNPGTENATMYRPDKIYFRQPNGPFKWSADTVNISYKSAGRNRQIVSIQQKPEHYDEMFILNNRQYDICPHNFQKDTWYYVKIHDQRVAKTFLYIDRNKRFHVYKVNIAICPV